MLETLKKPLTDRSLREKWQSQTLVHRVNVNETERFGSLVGGALLALYGLIRRSPGGLGLLGLGGYLIYRGLTGHCPAYETLGMTTASRTEQLQFKSDHNQESTSPRPQNSPKNGSSVDETAWETFPASDAPSWTTTRAGEESL